MHDWDSTQVPVLADLTIGGQPRKVVMFANRNGFFYVLDRVTGKVIVAKPFVETTWAKEIGADGRPVLLPGHLPDEDGEKTCPDLGGGTNFMSPSLRSGDAPVLRHGARDLRDVLRRSTRSSSRASSTPAARTHAAARSEELRRAARDRSGHRRR